MHTFRFYEGSTTCSDYSLSISENIVLELVEEIPGHKNYKLYYDNWFISIPSVEKEQARGIWSVGTIIEYRIPN